MIDFGKTFVADLIFELGLISEEDYKVIDQVVSSIYTKCISNKVVVIGIGKSGIIGQKLSSTLSSTGTPSFFLNAAEAGHGDLGMLSNDDLVIALSQSGKGEEILKIMPIIKSQGIPIVAITESVSSPLGLYADYVISSAVRKEGCPLNLAPMYSTTKTLVLCDLISSGLMLRRGFKIEDFARTHPFGNLGKRLILEIGSIVNYDENFIIREESTFLDLLTALTKGGMGVAVCLNEQHEVIGVITDGDLRRHIQQNNHIDVECNIRVLLNKCFKSVSSSMLASDALKFMQKNKLNNLPVIRKDGRFLGLVSFRVFSEKGLI
jgi:arabinose-5-phosphate isomerase